MILEISDEQKYLLLKNLGVAHLVEHIRGRDNSDLEQLIVKVVDSLKKEGKEEIVNRVFQEHKE